MKRMKKREAALLVSLFCCISMAAQLPVLILQKWNDATTEIGRAHV